MINLHIDLGQLVTILVGAGGAFSLIGYFVARFRQGKEKGQKDVATAQVLAEQTTTYIINALKEKVELLENTVHDQQAIIDSHTKEIEFLKGENKTLQELVKTALTEYFQNNPSVAKNISKAIQ